jgi:hypothetical protein
MGKSTLTRVIRLIFTQRSATILGEAFRGGGPTATWRNRQAGTDA